SAAEELAAQAQQLASLVGQFRLSASARPVRRAIVEAPRRRPPELPKPRDVHFAKPQSSNGKHASGNLAELLIPMDGDAELRAFWCMSPSVTRTRTMNRRVFEAFRELAYREAGIAMKDTKEALLSARIAKRVRALSLGSESEYLAYLQADTGGAEMRH